MKVATAQDYSIETLFRFASGVTFFKELMHQDPDQYALLQSHLKFLVAEPREEIIQHGMDDKDVYFVLRGQLNIVDNTGGLLGHVHPGEPMGIMSVLLNKHRSASVVVDQQPSLLATLPYHHLMYLADDDLNRPNESLFTLSTRILFYRLIDHQMRWSLELKRTEHGSFNIEQAIYTLPLIKTRDGTVNELSQLHQLAVAQARILNDWNQAQRTT